MLLIVARECSSEISENKCQGRRESKRDTARETERRESVCQYLSPLGSRFKPVQEQCMFCAYLVFTWEIRSINPLTHNPSKEGNIYIVLNHM